MEKKGLVHIYTGDGKGKTTAALGLAVRARGAGMRVLVAQFLKGRDTAELAPLRTLGVKLLRTHTDKFVPYMDTAERAACRQEQQTCLDRVRETAGDFDLVVLDEIFGAVATGMVEPAALTDFVRGKPPALELVLTGRDAPAELIALADYVSDIRCVRHPYDNGVSARRGIEF